MTYRFEMMGRPFKFTAEAYYKALSHLVPYSIDNVKVTYYGENTASGHATGLDLKLFGEFVPGADSWLTLSVMNTSMKLNGKRIPLPTDQRYALNLYFTDFLPRDYTMAYVAQIGLCRRSAVLCTTPGTGEQHLPSTRL